MALGITDLKKGAIFKFNGEPFKVVEYSQKVMGRGGSIVNVRIKSLIDGKVLEKTFKGNEQLDSADINYADVQYLYHDQHGFHFMTNSTFAQVDVSNDIIGDQAGYFKEGDSVMIQLFEGRPIGIDLPKNVPLKVTYAEDVVKGDTTSSVLKEAELETGIKVKVPAFIKTGDVIKIDTRTGEYLERAK